MFVNNQRGIQRRGQHFDKKFVFGGIHSKEVDTFLTDELPEKSLIMRGADKLLENLRDTGTVDRRPCSGRPRSARTEESVETVNDLVLNQVDKPQTHRTVREISWETSIHRSYVCRMICKDLRLKCFKRRRAQKLTDANCAARMKRAKLLLQKFPQSATDFVFFTDENVFSVASPDNRQNDRVYAPCDTRKRSIAAERLMRCRPMFSKSLMVSSENFICNQYEERLAILNTANIKICE